MQDRFKFRAWDTEEGKYASDDDIRFDTGRLCDSVYDLLKNDDPFYIYEQCTGLRDKNGELIYEGDIIAMSSTDRRQNCLEILWQNDECQLQAVAHNGLEDYFANLNEILEDHLMEVIGNIHENPELLEEK